MKKNAIRNIIIIAVIAGAGFYAYKFFVLDKQAATGGLETTGGLGVGVSDTAAASAGSAVIDSTVTQEFLAQLLNIQSIKLNDTIFKNKSFLVLQDFNREIPPDTNPGRPNPFAPLGADSAGVSTQISTSNPSSITPTSSVLNGALAVADPSLTRWFEYGTTTALGQKTQPKTQLNPGTFAETITGLQPNTTYYVKAVAAIGDTIFAGNLVSWKTAQGGTQQTTAPPPATGGTARPPATAR